MGKSECAFCARTSPPRAMLQRPTISTFCFSLLSLGFVSAFRFFPSTLFVWSIFLFSSLSLQRAFLFTSDTSIMSGMSTTGWVPRVAVIVRQSIRQSTKTGHDQKRFAFSGRQIIAPIAVHVCGQHTTIGQQLHCVTYLVKSVRDAGAGRGGMTG